MTPEELKLIVVRGEGYAEGFRAGYISLATLIAKKLQDESVEKSQAEKE